MGRLVHTGLGSSSLIAHVLHSPPPPREQLCNRSCSNKTHPPWVGSRSPDTCIGVGIRSPIGLVVGSCTSHPGVLGLIPKREESGKTGAPCVKVPGSSRVPVRDGQTSPHKPPLVVPHSTCPSLSPSPPRINAMRRRAMSHNTCPPLSSSPHAHSFVIGPAVINTHTDRSADLTEQPAQP